MDRVDVVVVGGGLLGLATAHDLLGRRPELRVAVLEKESDLATHQSGRNSGVVHSGIYYEPGSLKARLCREGRAMLERFTAEHDIPHEACGKLIVAIDQAELPALGELAKRARANGVDDIEEVGPERIRELEPHARGIAGLHAPSTAITDFRAVALALGEGVRGRGGAIHLGRAVTSIRARGGRLVVGTSRGALEARFLVGCSGLQSDRVAAFSGGSREPRIVPFRGSYHRLTRDATGLVNGLLYPVPDPLLPFLGVHFTRQVDGAVWVGPSAVLALAREGSKPWQVNPRDVGSTLWYAGFWRLAARHWRTGIVEIRQDLSSRAFLRACREYLPELRREHLEDGSFGVRAQAVHRDGSLEDDFALTEGPGVIHLRNAPSPGATSSLAIGRMLAERVLTRLDQASR